MFWFFPLQRQASLWNAGSCLSGRVLTTQTREKVQLQEMSSVGRLRSADRPCLLKRCQSGFQLPLPPCSSLSQATVTLPAQISALILLACHEDAYSSETTWHRVNLGACLSPCVFLDETILRYNFFPYTGGYKFDSLGVNSHMRWPSGKKISSFEIENVKRIETAHKLCNSLCFSFSFPARELSRRQAQSEHPNFQLPSCTALSTRQ